jgi:hypothetical protein
LGARKNVGSPGRPWCFPREHRYQALGLLPNPPLVEAVFCAYNQVPVCMLNSIGNIFGRKPGPKSGPVIPEPPSAVSALKRQNGDRRPTFSKVFRWRMPDGQTAPPHSVEVVGSFTHWQKMPLTRDSAMDAWHVTFHNILGNRTHHYMLLVDGKPTHDKTCDGIAVPHGPDEERFQIMTERGPRVFMLFAQTK